MPGRPAFDSKKDELMQVSERIYRWLLRVYPREFRDEYGEDMSLMFWLRSREGARLWLQILGDLTLHAPREHWSMTRQDVRYALRSWRRAPAIPAIALTALTFGIGMNVAVFSVVHAVLLRPLPVPDPARLVLLHENNVAQGLDRVAVSLPNYQSWVQQARSLQLAAFSGQSLTWTGPEYPERLEALAATASYASVVAARLERGRWFKADEEYLGAHRVVVLSHRLWRTRFASDSGIVGRQLVFNGFSYDIVGIASAEFTVPSEPDVWVPQVIDQNEPRRGNRHEFGVRIALGARPSTLPIVVVAQGLRYTIVGVALGLSAAGLVVERMRGLLFGVEPRDPLTFAGVALVVLVVASCASYVPARRAATVDPLLVLRAE
jgi:MacB-like periplasmic core domain